MSAKTLSNGTLSLRFMQNAHRAKMQAQAELEQAKVKDDAEWEVSQEVKDAWGIGSSTHPEDHIVHETSYLPFLFPTGTDAGGPSSGVSSDSPARLRGRRTFDKRGQEIIEEQKPQSDDEETISESATRFSATQGGTKRPTSISGFKASAAIAGKDGKKTRTKTAQMLIRENPPARSAPATLPENRPDGGTSFMKPAGIDEPTSRASKASAARKRDREQDISAGTIGLKDKKRKKKVEIS